MGLGAVVSDPGISSGSRQSDQATLSKPRPASGSVAEFECAVLTLERQLEAEKASSSLSGGVKQVDGSTRWCSQENWGLFGEKKAGGAANSDSPFGRGLLE